MPSRFFQLWSSDEDRLLTSILRAGGSFGEVAEAVGRSRDAVAGRVRTLRLRRAGENGREIRVTSNRQNDFGLGASETEAMRARRQAEREAEFIASVQEAGVGLYGNGPLTARAA